MNSLRKVLVFQLFVFMLLLVADAVICADNVSRSFDEVAEVITETSNPDL